MKEKSAENFVPEDFFEEEDTQKGRYRTCHLAGEDYLALRRGADPNLGRDRAMTTAIHVRRDLQC